MPDLYPHEPDQHPARSSRDPDLLAHAATSHDPCVRTAVARNQHSAARTLASLASDPDLPVRVSVASHPSTAPETLTLLAEDAEREVRLRVAWHPNTPAATLSVLARDSDTLIRCRIADNPRTSPDDLDLLSQSTEYLVQENVARNPVTTEATLRRMTRTPGPAARPAQQALNRRAADSLNGAAGELAHTLLPTWTGNDTELLIATQQIRRPARP